MWDPARNLFRFTGRMAASCLCLLAWLPSAHGQSKPVPHSITLANGKRFELNLPEGFDISVAAEGLKRVRFMAKAPDGRIFVTDMYNLADNSNGTIYILDGFDPKAGKFRHVKPYLQHLRNPNAVAFYKDPSGQNWLYVPLTDKLERFRFQSGDEAPSAPPEILANYPDYGLDYRFGGWHLTRTVALGDKGRLFISVGSSCDACEEKESIRATISAMDPDGGHSRIVARGLRNAVGLRLVDGVLYATNMGADHLGNDAPDDTMFAFGSDQLGATSPANYGWPACYLNQGKALPDPKFASLPGSADCTRVPAPFAVFPAHSAPLGLDYFDSNAPTALHNRFLVALHGSSNKRLARGYKVVSVLHDGKQEDFLTGFLHDGVIFGRPCDILRLSTDSFLLTDDSSGVVYYIHR